MRNDLFSFLSFLFQIMTSNRDEKLKEKKEKRETKKDLYILKWICSICFDKKKPVPNYFRRRLRWRPKHFENQP